MGLLFQLRLRVIFADCVSIGDVVAPVGAVHRGFEVYQVPVVVYVGVGVHVAALLSEKGRACLSSSGHLDGDLGSACPVLLPGCLFVVYLRGLVLLVGRALRLGRLTGMALLCSPFPSRTVVRQFLSFLCPCFIYFILCFGFGAFLLLFTCGILSYL